MHAKSATSTTHTAPQGPIEEAQSRKDVPRTRQTHPDDPLMLGVSPAWKAKQPTAPAPVQFENRHAVTDALALSRRSAAKAPHWAAARQERNVELLISKVPCTSSIKQFGAAELPRLVMLMNAEVETFTESNEYKHTKASAIVTISRHVQFAKTRFALSVCK